MYDSIYKEVLIMRVKFTTTLNSKLLEKIKIKAVEEKTDVSKILEKLIILYLIDKWGNSLDLSIAPKWFNEPLEFIVKRMAFSYELG